MGAEASLLRGRVEWGQSEFKLAQSWDMDLIVGHVSVDAVPQEAMGRPE